MSKLKQLNEFKQELKMIERNIQRVEKYVSDTSKYKEDDLPNSCQVFGELKHRLIALKRSILLITEIPTRDLFDRK